MIAGMTFVYDFPLDVFTILELARRVDVLVLRLDAPFIDRRPQLDELVRNAGPDVTLAFSEGDEPFTRHNHSRHREAALRLLDGFRPDYVLQPDTDETFGPGFDKDFARFRDSGRDLMMFAHRMVTIDQADVPRVPGSPHCRAFRWRPGLQFSPRYAGFCCPRHTQRLTKFKAASQMLHYCFYTADMQQQRLKRMTDQNRKRFGWRKTK